MFLKPGILLLATAVIHSTTGYDSQTDDNIASSLATSRHYTEMMVQGAGHPEQKCSDRVLASRKAAIANGKTISVGVEPTVSLGAALLIFVGVGLFAVVIAQSFQMVSFSIVFFLVSIQISLFR